MAGADLAARTVALEATGVYWLALHAWCVARGVARVLVRNPLQTRAFRHATLRGSTTDRIAAVAIAQLVRWMGAPLSSHVLPDDRHAAAMGGRRPAARDVSRLRVEMVELRARQLVKRGAVLDRSFPEFRPAFGKLGSASALAVLTRWATPAA